MRATTPHALLRCAIVVGIAGILTGPGGLPTTENGHALALQGRRDAYHRQAGTGVPLPHTVRIGGQPIALTVDGATDRVFVLSLNAHTNPDRGTSGGPGRVRVLDGATGQVVRTVAVGNDPVALAADARRGRVFVATLVAADRRGDIDPHAGTVYTLDATSGAPIHTTAVNLYPTAIAADARTGRVFVVGHEGRIGVLDASTGRVRHTGHVASGDDATAVAVDEQSGHVLVYHDNGADRSGQIGVLDATTGTLRRTTDLAVGGYALAVDPSTSHAFALGSLQSSSGGAVTVYTLDTRTGGLVQSVDINTVTSAAAEASVAVNSRTHRAYVASTGELESPGCVSVLDTRDGRVLSHHTVGRGPLAVAVDNHTRRVFVTNGNDGTVSVLDAARL